MTDFEILTDFSNLYNAFKDSYSGNKGKISSAKFSTLALEGILLIQESLINKTFSVSDYNIFKIHEPKERIIMSGSFKDRIVQHNLCDNILLPKLSNVFIKENFAGQLNKGTSYGLSTLKNDMLTYFNENGMHGYIVKGDIKKYFYSIVHDLLKEIVRYHVTDDNVFEVCEKFIDSTNGVGIPLGNQLSQVFALLYLDGFDHFIKEELCIKYYGRYMDDFYIIHNNKEYIKYCLSAIELFINSLKLALNSKTQIMPFKNGIKYLGFHTYVSDSGQIVTKLDNSKKRNALKKYIKMAHMVVNGELSIVKFNESYHAWKNHVEGGGCYDLVKCVDEKITRILTGEVA